MADNNWQAGCNGSRPASAAVWILAIVLQSGPAWAMSPDPVFAGFVPSGFAAGTSSDILLGSLVVLSFVAAVALWSTAAMYRIRRAEARRNAMVSSALNNLGQGIVMVDAAGKVVFCNDRYLEIYGLKRADLPKKLTGVQLAELGSVLDATLEQFYEWTLKPGGHVFEIPGDRAVRIKRHRLPNGSAVTSHEDVSEERRLARQLASTKNFLELVIDNVPVCIAAKCIEDGRYIFANRAFEKFSGRSRTEVVGRRADELFTARTAAAIDAADRAAIDSPDGQFASELVSENDGAQRILATTRVVVRNDRGQPEFIIALFEDATERMSLSEQLANAKKFLELVVDNIPISVTVESVRDRRYLLANRKAEAILNRSREEATGLTSADLFNPREASLIVNRDNAAIRSGGMHTEEHPISTRDGLRLFLTRRVTVSDESGVPQYLIKTHEDVTDRRQTESRMAHMAYHDGLTDLPNRAAFLQALTQMIEACAGSDEQFAVLSVDLDGMKEVNDVYGHTVGDTLLIEVSRRIEAVATGGVVARLSGDEFGLLIDGPQPDVGMALAESLARTLTDEFMIDGKSVRSGLTVGVALYPRDGRDPAALLANSEAALFRAKAHSRGSISLFEPEMDRQMRDRRMLHQELAGAIRNGELLLHYQPLARADAAGGRKTIGFEALARWVHPTRGFVPPGEFIPMAEESGLIVEMGEWILREACREAASWPNPLQVAVNLSPAQFMHGDVVSLLHSILLETGLQPSRLELEITEGVLIEDFERGLALLRRLKALGVGISMDDFGSGYSSLTYLQEFPFDKIKIDRAFVANIGHSSQSEAIVRAVIKLGHGLGMTLVAEGVETEVQLRFLTDERCDVVQGYLIGKPAPIWRYAAAVGLPEAATNARVRRAC